LLGNVPLRLDRRAAVRQSARTPGRKAFGNRPAARHKGDMALIAIFLMGVGNFAVHKAVLESGHHLLDRLAAKPGARPGRFTLAVEFAVLFAALLGAANGWAALAWAYLIYTLANGLSAWLILTGRV
jgi:hypothetical protein